MSAYIRDLQKRVQPTETVNHVGWDRAKVNIILPDRILRSDGSAGPVSLGKPAGDLPTLIRTGGTLAEQKRLMHFYNRPEYIPNQLFVMAALGSPLLFATGHHGVIFNAYSDVSGTSKSTTLYTGAGLYGPPEEYAMTAVKEVGGSDLYRADRMFAYHSLPFMFDELSLLSPEEVRSIAMQVSQGTRRRIMDRSGNPKPNPFGEGVLRHSIMVSTANLSLYHALSNFPIAGTAATMRVFEVEFRRQSVHTKAEARQYLWDLNQNFGWIGPEFLKLLVQVREKAIQRVQRVTDELGNQTGARQDERFWIGGCAAALVAGDLAARAGLTPYNPAPVRDWLVNTHIPHLRSVVSEQSLSHDPTTLLMDFVEQNNGKILKVYAYQNATFDNTKPHGELIGHFDTDKGWLHVLKASFKEHCKRRGLDGGDVLRRLFYDNVVTSTDKMFVLGKGLRDYEKGHSRCFCVNMRHPAIAGVAPKLTVVASGPGASAAVQAAAP